MSFDITILAKKIDGLKQSFESGRFADALVTALNSGNGLMQQRIFTENVDIEGKSFGQYIGSKRKARLIRSSNKLQDKRNKNLAGQLLTPYQRKRLAAGRQILRKDLEFSGGLRRAINTVVEGERAAVLEFNNNDAAKIARGQENQITNIRNGSKAITTGNGTKIFRFNEDERKQVNEKGSLLIKQILK